MFGLLEHVHKLHLHTATVPDGRKLLKEGRFSQIRLDHLPEQDEDELGVKQKYRVGGPDLNSQPSQLVEVVYVAGGNALLGQLQAKAAGTGGNRVSSGRSGSSNTAGGGKAKSPDARVRSKGFCV